MITVQKEALTTAARQANALAAKKSPVMIHSHAALRLREGVLEVGAFNGQGIWGSVSVPAEGDIDRDFCVESSLLVSALGSATGSEVTLDTINSASVQLKSGRAKWRLATLPADDFVDVPAIEAEPIVLSGAKLASLLETATYMVKEDASRPYMTGVRVAQAKTDGPWIEVRATDGHRAVISRDRFDGLPECSWAVFVPLHAAGPLSKWLAGRGDVALRVGARQLAAADVSARAVISVQLGEDHLPPLEKIMPSGGRAVRVSSADIADAARGVAPAARGDGIALSFAEGVVTLRADGDSEASIEVPCDWAQGPARVGLNYRYLVDCVSHSRADEVVLEIGKELDTIVVRNDESTYRCGIAPMKV